MRFRRRIITTTPWMEVFDPEQAEQELEDGLRDVDNPWVVSGSLAAMPVPWQMAATTADTSAPAPVDASTVAAAHVATASVHAAVQPREMETSAATTAPRQVAATTIDTSAPPLLEVSTVADEDAATVLVDAVVQPREMDASAATTAP